VKYKILILIACSIFVVACSGRQTQPPVVISNSPFPTATFTLAPTPKPTNPPPPSVTSSPTFPPYQVKDVLFEYRYAGGDHGIFDGFVDPHISKLILYSDGLLIVTKDSLYEKLLSEEDVRLFMSQIEQRGFYQIETNQQHDPSDKLYNFNNNYERVFHARYLCIFAPTKSICAYDPLLDYVIPSMKNIFKFLDNYFPSNMTPYPADRILLQIIKGSDYLPEEIRPELIEWSADLPPLQETPTLFVDGESAAKIFKLFGNSVGWRIMTYNNTEYTVFARPVLPHEIITQP